MKKLLQILLISTLPATTAFAEGSTSLKPFDYKPQGGWFDYINTGTGFVCALPSLVEEMRQLVVTKRLDLAEQVAGCAVLTTTAVGEQIQSYDSGRWEVMELRFVLADGTMITGWSSGWVFKTNYQLFIDACRAADNTDEDCSAAFQQQT